MSGRILNKPISSREESTVDEEDLTREIIRNCTLRLCGRLQAFPSSLTSKIARPVDHVGRCTEPETSRRKWRYVHGYQPASSLRFLFLLRASSAPAVSASLFTFFSRFKLCRSPNRIGFFASRRRKCNLRSAVWLCLRSLN